MVSDNDEQTTAATPGRDVGDVFAERLLAFEQNRDVEPLVELFAEDAELSKLDQVQVHHGRDGARAFWQDYRAVFDALESRFTAHTRAEGRSVLEWVAEGTLAGPSGGRDITYPGVSILEIENGAVTKFRTYYDSGPFIAPRADSASA